MTTIDFDTAQALAKRRIDEISQESGVEMELVFDRTREVEQGWVFFYNSTQFLRTKDPSWMLAGNGPLLVTRFGTLQELPSHIPWEEAIRGAKSK
ncbi:YrhB domain-containing protein [Lysobacter tyrosinilyticus]